MKPSPSRQPPPAAAAGITPFQRRVYAALSRIPRGQVATYAALARAVGCASPRAVGQALRRNPFAPTVPCHRIIAADLTLGGFNGHRAGPELERKRALLAAEGVRFDRHGRLAEPAQLFPFPATPATTPTPPDSAP
ncbi:MAG: MGMT family protein [Lentisphaeria bacterium]|jgi:methylated-DNA-[protein]-cysteine S-methyltransferase